MTKMVKSLFRDEVYTMMQEKVGGPSNFAGIEEALDMIREDEKFQKFLREYAIKNKIERKGWAMYGHGDPKIEDFPSGNFVNYEIRFWERNKENIFLAIYPDPKAEIAPIFYHAHWHGAIIRQADGSFYHPEGWNSLEVVRRKNGYYLEGNLNKKHSPHLHNTRLIDTLTNASKREILTGLEKAVKNLL